MLRRNIRNKKGESFIRSFMSLWSTLIFLAVGYFLIFGNPFEPDHDGPMIMLFNASQRIQESGKLDGIFPNELPINETNTTPNGTHVGGAMYIVQNPQTEPTPDLHSDILEDIQDDGLNLDLLNI